MDVSEFEKYLSSQFNTLYSFAYNLIPDELQASQVCIDAISTLLLEDADIIDDFQNGRKEDLEIRIKLNRYAYNLCQKRENQLPPLMKGDNPHNKFYELDLQKRAIISLRENSAFSIEEIEKIIDKRNYEIINEFELAKNQIETQGALIL